MLPKVPGFRRFIVENFVARCCFYNVLDNTFELRDAHTYALFGEIVVAQKVIYENVRMISFYISQ
jgi:exportin-T